MNATSSTFLGGWREWCLAGLVAISPWYDCVRFTPSLHINRPILSQLTNTGLINVSIVCFYLMILVPPLIASFRMNKVRAEEWLILAWPALHCLNFKRLDIPGIISLYNSVFFAVCLLVFLRSKEIFQGCTFLPRRGILILLGSYSAGIVLPLLIPLGNYPVFVSAAGIVTRFQGWSGVGSLSFAAVTLGAWGLLVLLRLQNSTQDVVIGLVSVAVGVFGTHFTVLRIGWVALLMMNSAALIYCIFLRGQRQSWIMLAVLVLNVSSIHCSQLVKKGGQGQLSLHNIVSDFNLVKLGKFFFSLNKHADRISTTPQINVVPVPKYNAVAVAGKNEVNPVPTAVSSKPTMPFVTVATPVKPVVVSTKSTGLSQDQQTIFRYAESYLWNFNAASNGRVAIGLFLLGQMQGHILWGLGTGGAGRALRAVNFPALEAHNDYLRFFVDHGVIGFSLFLSILLIVYRASWRQRTFIVFLGMTCLMLTDNYLIYPSFAYGPLFVVLFCERLLEEQAVDSTNNQ